MLFRTTLLALIASSVASSAFSQTTLSPVAVPRPHLTDPVMDAQEITLNDAETDGLEVDALKHINPRLVVFTGLTYGPQSTDPKWRGRIAADWAIAPRVSIGVSFLGVAARSGQDAGGDPIRTPGYTRFDAKVAFALSPHVQFSIVGYNLGGSRIIDAPADPNDVATGGSGPTVRAAVLFKDY
jgi:outer membrane receptor protein involved in Fe transport